MTAKEKWERKENKGLCTEVRPLRAELASWDLGLFATACAICDWMQAVVRQ